MKGVEKMYKIGDEIELECYINAMHIVKCDSGFNHELRKYFLRYAINDLPAGVYNYEDFIKCEGAAWVGSKVKVNARIIGIDGDLYRIKLPNGNGDVIDRVYLPKKYCLDICTGDKVSVDFDIISVTFVLDRKEFIFTVKAPGTRIKIQTNPIGVINKTTITCDGIIKKVYDDGEVDIYFEDLCLKLRLNSEFVKRKEDTNEC